MFVGLLLAAMKAPLLPMHIIVSMRSEYLGRCAGFHGLPEAVSRSQFLVPGMTPLLGFYLQAGRLESLPLLAVLPLCFLQFAMLLLIEFPDATGDAAVGKRTLVVRLGGAGAARLYAGVLLTGYLIVPALILAGLPSVQSAEIENNLRLYAVIASMLRNSPQLFNLYVGYEDGSFLEIDVIDRAKSSFRDSLNADRRDLPGARADIAVVAG